MTSFTEHFTIWRDAINIACETEKACNGKPTMTIDQNAACNFLANLCTLLVSRYPTPLQDDVRKLTENFRTITVIKPDTFVVGQDPKTDQEKSNQHLYVDELIANRIKEYIDSGEANDQLINDGELPEDRNTILQMLAAEYNHYRARQQHHCHCQDDHMKAQCFYSCHTSLLHLEAMIAGNNADAECAADDEQ
jgi:hypothetical protein